MASAGFRHKSGVNGGSDFKSCVIIHYIVQNSRKVALWGLGGAGKWIAILGFLLENFRAVVP
jgi:hypothetical protein